LDASGNAYITGWTYSWDFPTVNPFQAAKSGFANSFVAKIPPDGKKLVYSTYFGFYDEQAHEIAVDLAGNAHVFGHTYSDNLMLVNPIQSVRRGDFDMFVMKLNPSGSAVLFSTYFGRTNLAFPGGITVHTSSNTYIAGWTSSSNIPIAAPFQANLNGASDAFIARIDTADAKKRPGQITSQ